MNVALKDSKLDSKIYYENEREKHLNHRDASINKLLEAKRLLYSKQTDPLDKNHPNTCALVSPLQRRDENKKIRNHLDNYYHFKQNHKEISHRERNIKAGWRHGVTGLENAESVNTSVMFKEQSE